MTTLTISLSQINEGDRARKIYGDLTGLKNSLSSLGSIHPIVLSKNGDGTFTLIAGGRRFRSAKELGTNELFHGSILEPGKIGFLFRDEVSADVLKEAELDENLYRLKPKWQENVILIADVHELKVQKAGGPHRWGQSQTADLLGPGYGVTNVSYALRIAKLLRANDVDIVACETISDAIATMIKRKEEQALAELQKRTLPGVGNVVVIGPPAEDSFLDNVISMMKGGGKSEAMETATKMVEEINKAPATGGPVRIPFSTLFRCGDFREILPQWPTSSIDHIVTDIPYGIDMDNMDTRDMSSVASEHDVKENVDLMEPFLKEAFRLVRSGGFCVFCYDLDWHEYLQSTAENIGWKVQRWPLIIHKTSSCQNNAASYNFTKNYESIMVLRRDEKTVLRSQQASSVWTGDFAAERKLYNNPFAKPFTLWKWLFDAVAFPGQSVLDPFAGEMSSCRAAANCGLVPYGVELKPDHFQRGLEHMKAVYAVIHGSNVEFV